MFNLPLASFLISAGIYGAIAAASYATVRSLFDYFHTDVERNGVVVLVLGNLTLGTGLVYLSQLGAREGYYAFIGPGFVLIGYLLLARMTLALKPAFANKPHLRSYLDLVRCAPEAEQKASQRILRIYVSFQVVVYVLLCAFELSASSDLLSRLINIDDSAANRLLVAGALLAVAVAYTSAGGLRAAVATDWIQALFVMAGLGALLVTAERSASIGTTQTLTDALNSAPQSPGPVALTLFAVAYNAIATQFYSVLNVSISTNYLADGQVRVFGRTGLLVSLSLAAFVGVGILIAPQSDTDMTTVLAEFLQGLSRSSSSVDKAMAATMAAGFLALVLSTLDGTISVIQQAIWDAKSPGVTHSKALDLASVSRARFFTVLVGLAIAVFAAIFLYISPAIVPLILTIIWPLAFIAPIFAISALYVGRTGESILRSATVQLLVVTAAIALWAALFAATMAGSDGTGWASLIAIASALLYWGVEHLRGRLHRARPPLP